MFYAVESVECIGPSTTINISVVVYGRWEAKIIKETTWIFMGVLSSITLDQSQLEWSSTNTTNNKLLFRPLKASDRMKKNTVTYYLV